MTFTDPVLFTERDPDYANFIRSRYSSIMKFEIGLYQVYFLANIISY